MAIYSEFSHKKNVIFHSYVSLPEGMRFQLTTLYPSEDGKSPFDQRGCTQNSAEFLLKKLG
jgi:hypothetical protein